MNKTVIVTGGSGYIGSHTLVELLQSGFDVISLDNYSNSSPEIYKQVAKITGKYFLYYQVELTSQNELAEIFSKHDVCGVIHFAAFKAVGESVEHPIKYYDNNLNSLLNLLRICKRFSVQNFIFSSSCSVYGNVEQLPVSEETPLLKAESPYAYTKQIGERILEDFCVSNPHFNSISLRYFNPVGAHESALIGESPINKPNNLLPIITGVAAGTISKLVVNGNDYPTRDGTCIRDYIHVSDIAEAHVKALSFLLSDGLGKNYDVFNLGTGSGVSVMEAIHAFENVTGLKLNYEIGPRRLGDVIAVYADNSKANQMLNWKPKFGIEKMIETAWNWEKNKNKL